MQEQGTTRHWSQYTTAKRAPATSLRNADEEGNRRLTQMVESDLRVELRKVEISSQSPSNDTNAEDSEDAELAPLGRQPAFGAGDSPRRTWRMVGMLGVRKWRGNARAGGPDEIAERRVTEVQLLRAGQAGDRRALEQLLVPYERPLYALCRGILGHADDAEDAVQETFLRALRAMPAFLGDAAVRSWLYRIAVNVCLDRKRPHRPTEPWDEERWSATDHAGSPERIALRHLRLSEALGRLLPRQRVILLLKELEGWSVGEIAFAMSWNEKKVYNELYRARRVLADWQRRDAAEGDE